MSAGYLQWIERLGQWGQHHQALMLYIVGGGMALMVVTNLLWRRRAVQLDNSWISEIRHPPRSRDGRLFYQTRDRRRGGGRRDLRR
jgi:hypothetical protein